MWNWKVKLMKNRYIPLQTASIIALAALVAMPAAADNRAGGALSADVIQKQITYLASDELRGRGSGEPGNEKAARFIAEEFRHAGLKPLGTGAQRDPNAAMDGSGYFQPFRFIAGRAVGHGCRLQAEFKGSWHGYQAGHDFEPSSISGGGSAEGEVVFAGFGIRAPDAKHDDYAGLAVKGKIVLLLAGNPKDDPHSPLAEFSGIRRKALTARELGAAAVLVVSPVKSDAQGSPGTEFFDASDAGLPVLKLKHNIATDWLSTAGKSLGDLERQANDEKSVSTPAGISVRLAADVKKVEKVTANVVGMLEGSDPALKNEYVIIGAHLDHLGMGGPGSLDRSNKPAIHHGADDNASGSAGVMSLAHWFGSRAEKPKRSLIFMCFSGEELGLFGSDFYAKHAIIPIEKTAAMINMDMIGRLRENKLIVIGSGTAKEWDGLLTEANRSAGFQLARSEDGFGASDQQSFYSKNVPVLFFFTGSHSDYHTSTDTADKINAEGEVKVLAMVAYCMETIANSPERPTFQKIDVPTPGGSPGFRVYFGSIPDYAAQVVGVQLNGVREKSPAAKAGLKAGDIIVKFGDTTVKGIQDYTLALQNYKPGDEVDVVVQRGGQTLTLHARLIARPE
jgi:aminopeptidase YwaD